MQATQIRPMAVAVLAAMDCIILIDHSGSMAEASLRFSGKTRLQEVEEACTSIARDAQQHDADGITIIAFNGTPKTFDGVTADRVKTVFQEFPPRGSTALHLAIAEAVAKAKGSSKQTCVIVYTDGAPDDENAVIKALNDAGSTMTRTKIGFTFVQVGTDAGATAFLEKLDDGLKVDICDTIPAGEADNLGYPELAYCAFNG